MTAPEHEIRINSSLLILKIVSFHLSAQTASCVARCLSILSILSCASSVVRFILLTDCLLRQRLPIIDLLLQQTLLMLLRILLLFVQYFLQAVDYPQQY